MQCRMHIKPQRNIWLCHQAYACRMRTISGRNAHIYLPLVLGVRLAEVEPVAEEDRGGDCNLRQLEPGADVAEEAAVGGPELGLLGRADAVPPRRRAALDLLPAQVPRPGPPAAALPRVAVHRDPRRRQLRNRGRKDRNFPFLE